MKCQRLGHVAANCPSHPRCVREVREMHRTVECVARDDERACSNCRAAKREYRGHGRPDRACPTFEDALQFALERNPDAAHPYFLVEDPSTWVTHEEDGRTVPRKWGAPTWKTNAAQTRRGRTGPECGGRGHPTRADDGGVAVVPQARKGPLGDMTQNLGRPQGTIDEYFATRAARPAEEGGAAVQTTRKLAPRCTTNCLSIWRASGDVGIQDKEGERGDGSEEEEAKYLRVCRNTVLLRLWTQPAR
ncbi:hypothetical protein B0H14DRAFT_3662080 [Mycena olivaceomarginata]|nr:hypothetical protein B0H14DRAFT_3662080 [Mycena olivaceomarginata]